jgi:hypothetical protein
MSKGETVKYVIDADTSGFARGMAEAALESGIAGKTIDRNLSRTSKRSEDNFKDIRRSAATAASSIRNFGVAMQALNVTSLIIGVTALSGAILELSGAIAAAGSTASLLFPVLVQGAAGVETFKTGVTGLGKAFKALSKNDAQDWAKAMQNLGPAAQSVARAAGAIHNAFKSIQLNTQQALLNGVGDSMLKLGSQILPIVNNGMQIVGRAMNNTIKAASDLASTPIFRGLLSTVFNDTANTVNTLTGALSPLLTIFTELYAITRPYVAFLAQGVVNLLSSAAAYLSSARGQHALNISIQEGIIALKELGGLVGSVFGLLTSIFRTSVNAGNALIPTLTGIIKQMQAWVNSADGQAKLIALFNFTSLALQAVAGAIGRALKFFFTMVQVVDNLNPTIQRLIVGFLATSLTLRPLISYLSKLYLAFRLIAVTAFNVIEQAIVIFGVLGAVSSIVLVLAAGFIILATIIRGPLGSAFLIIGGIIAAYVGLNFLLGLAVSFATAAILRKAQAAAAAAQFDVLASETTILLANAMYYNASAAVAAAGGMSLAARGAALLQASLLGLLIAAAGVLIILNMLGVFGSKTKKAAGATTGFSSSLGSLQNAIKGVGSAGNKVSNNGLSALNDSLGSIGDNAAAATGSLASFDKMNVLTDNSAAGAGIAGLPKLPDLGGASLGAPTIDTSAFDDALKNMEGDFGDFSKLMGKGLPNPFKSIADWLLKHPLAGILIGITLAIVGLIAILTIFGVTSALAFLPLGILIGLVALGIIALIAVGILLWKNWDAIWAGIKAGAQALWDFLVTVWNGIFAGVKWLIEKIGSFFSDAWDGIKTVWNAVIGWFQAVWDGIVLVFSGVASWFSNAFQNAWNGIKIIWGAVTAWFQGIWNGIMGIFSGVAGWFGGIFGGAWNAITGVFGGLWNWFKTNVWDKIVSLFSSVGSSVGDAISGAVKGVINAVLRGAIGTINTFIGDLNHAIDIVNKLTPKNISHIPNIPVPQLAKGGIITSPTFAQIGEAGAEAVMPLENNTGWIDMLASKINSSNGGSNGQPIQLTVQIGEDKVATKIIDLINEKTQMSGRNTILV